MRPDEVKFNRLQVWARVMNLPYNLRDDAWAVPIAKQIDNQVRTASFDHVGGYLQARVTIDVDKPLRRWIMIDSARRNKISCRILSMNKFLTFVYPVAVWGTLISFVLPRAQGMRMVTCLLSKPSG